MAHSPNERATMRLTRGELVALATVAGYAMTRGAGNPELAGALDKLERELVALDARLGGPNNGA